MNQEKVEKLKREISKDNALLLAAAASDKGLAAVCLLAEMKLIAVCQLLAELGIADRDAMAAIIPMPSDSDDDNDINDDDNDSDDDDWD